METFDLGDVKGEQGEQGEQGETGAKGEAVLQGAGAPSNGMGSNGDSYVNSTTSNLYLKSGGTWSITGSLKGQKGDQGDEGDKGDTGTSIFQGTGVPSNGLGLNGDTYIQTTNGNVYFKASGTWSLSGNIKGVQGNSFEPDAIGHIADRSDFDSEPEGFAFLSDDEDPPKIYWREGVSGWSLGVPFASGGIGIDFIDVKYSDTTTNGTRYDNTVLEGYDFIMTLKNGIKLERLIDYDLIPTGGFVLVANGNKPNMHSNNIITLSDYKEATSTDTLIEDEDNGTITFF